ncbi:MAG: DUF4258 domain-containing protein [Robiginitalea sp.]|uniref:DUF4258 domain-containing protein n=1 Tax=Robiginitalea sp. TaxID=1902411 RepID=UPI003C74F37F
MPFLKRLGYFLVGLSIGLIFLAFFLRKKTDETGTEFCYFPNCIVLKELRSKPMRTDPALTVPIDTLLIQELLREGSVNFNASDTKASPCKLYRIEYETEGYEMNITLENCQEYTLLKAYDRE